MDWLFERFGVAHNKTAFVHEGREFKYSDVIDKTDYFVKVLEGAGIDSGKSVVVQGDYSPEVFCMLLALSRMDCIVIPLTKNSVVEESSVLEISGCDWYVDFNQSDIAPTITSRSVYVNNPLLNKLRETNSPGLVLFSSGSTGKPKGILHDFNRVIDKFRVQRDPVIAIPFLMIDHFGGINTILSITSSLGTVVTVGDRSVFKICEAIQAFKVQLLPATPSFLTLLVASKMYQKFDLSSLARISYGTEVMPQSTLDRVKDAFPGVVLQQTYGLSEVGVLRSKSKNDGSLWVKLGGDGFQTKIVDGVLWVKSEFAMLGYLNAESKFDQDGWFNTEDKVEVDGDYFRILGRVTDLINVGGEKVYPSEIESVILELDNIEDVAVFGESHGLLGQIVVAKVCLVTEEPVDSLKKRIRKACIEKLSHFKIPAKVIISTVALHSSRQKKIRKHI
jgi:acyl-CoA synthetase (AMP-forming)/AMP-acid ligase II